jgi:hypothetical protein
MIPRLLMYFSGKNALYFDEYIGWLIPSHQQGVAFLMEGSNEPCNVH